MWTLLAGLALVPLVGLTWLAISRVGVANDERAAAEDLAAATEEAVRAVSLDAALDEEQTWTQAAQLAGDLGFDRALLDQLLGVDLAVERDGAVARVDDLVAAMGDGEVATAIRDGLVEPRSGAFRDGELAARYETVREIVADHADGRFRAVVASLDRVGDGNGLVQAVLVVEAAAELRSAFSGQVGAFFSVQFDDLVIVDAPLEELFAEHERYHLASERLESLAAGAPGVATGGVLPTDPSVGAFLVEVDRYLTDALRAGGSAIPTIDLVDGPIDVDPATFERVVTSFRAASSGAAAHDDLVSAAGADVLGLVEAGASDARTTALWVMLGALGIGLVTAAVTLATARAILRPLRTLSEAAEALQMGDLTAEVPVSGPREVRSVGLALSDAVDNLRLGERQADALAVGSLDDPVFDVEARGRFGSSLQAAVDRLRASLAEREEFRRRLSHQAAHDGLTGLPNRRAVIEHLEQAVARTTRSKSVLAAFFVDVDSFKAVNDAFGHPAGDELLRVIAARLSEAVRGGDLVGRVGGDEFLVVAEPVADEEDAYALAERIRTAAARPVDTVAGVLEPTLSIGVATSVAGSFTADELIRDADLAVYLAKERGRDRTEICNDDLRRQALREADLDRAIRRGLDAGEFILHYQPVVDAASEVPVAVEALIRWDSPDHGLVGPDEFIDFAERSELILDIDRWVIRTAVGQLEQWRTVRSVRGLAVSVNISGSHLRAGTLPGDLRAAFEAHEVDPAQLIVEITESALLDDLDGVAADLAEIRRLGVRVAIDDFGTGYTSLAHLRTLPLDILKLDQSFVSTLESEDRSIVGLVIDTAHVLGVEVVIEGVETADQAEVVRALGCDLMQGYRFGHPVASAELVMAVRTARHADV